MARYFLELSYNGTAYNGWQIQNNAPSVQQTIESSLSKMLNEPIAIVGCGRTDSGVHASYYIAHFDSAKSDKIEADSFMYHLNCILPRDIAIKRVTKTDDNTHARFDAIEREYKYYITCKKSPFLHSHMYQYLIPLDVDKMNIAAELLLSYTDFTSFAKLHSGNKTNICDVKAAYWLAEDDNLIFTIRANRFLRNMVRAITGTIIDVGRGKLSLEQFKQIVESQDVHAIKSTAPAHGLYLTNVIYEDNMYRA